MVEVRLTNWVVLRLAIWPEVNPRTWVVDIPFNSDGVSPPSCAVFKLETWTAVKPASCVGIRAI